MSKTILAMVMKFRESLLLWVRRLYPATICCYCFLIEWKKYSRKMRKCWLPAFSPFPSIFSKSFFVKIVRQYPLAN